MCTTGPTMLAVPCWRWLTLLLLMLMQFADSRLSRCIMHARCRHAGCLLRRLVLTSLRLSPLCNHSVHLPCAAGLAKRPAARLGGLSFGSAAGGNSTRIGSGGGMGTTSAILASLQAAQPAARPVQALTGARHVLMQRMRFVGRDSIVNFERRRA